MAKFTTLTFTNDDLDSNFEVELIHGKNTENVILSWVDENNIDRTTTDVFTVLDANTIKVSCGSSVTGTQTVVVCYDDILSITGRKLFELANLSSLDDQNYRLALGKKNAPAVNVSLQNFLTWLTSVLPFMKGENGLSDIPTNKKGAARSNLSVYSKTEVDARVTPKLDAYSSGMGGGLGHLNSTPYTPVSDYNPATKKYVDDKFLGSEGTLSDEGRNTFVDSVGVLLFSVRSRIALLNIQITTLGKYTPEAWIQVGKVNKLPVVQQYGGGFSIQSRTYESILWTIKTDGTLLVKPGLNTTITWYLNISYFVA
ncbi:MAG: hypothetical protein BWY22_02438 [Bacteroidetes bacterium ADurb.Bin217]|nr:MAG: hypothetical protein BWY22_02438 [Bacteroidetes bacterium ADurb.Bin217]